MVYSCIKHQRRLTHITVDYKIDTLHKHKVRHRRLCTTAYHSVKWKIKQCRYTYTTVLKTILGKEEVYEISPMGNGHFLLLALETGYIGILWVIIYWFGCLSFLQFYLIKSSATRNPKPLPLNWHHWTFIITSFKWALNDNCSIIIFITLTNLLF